MERLLCFKWPASTTLEFNGMSHISIVSEHFEDSFCLMFRVSNNTNMRTVSYDWKWTWNYCTLNGFHVTTMSEKVHFNWLVRLHFLWLTNVVFYIWCLSCHVLLGLHAVFYRLCRPLLFSKGRAQFSAPAHSHLKMTLLHNTTETNFFHLLPILTARNRKQVYFSSLVQPWIRVFVQ